MKMEEIKDSVVEILWIIKTSLTTFWFWLPVLYAVYFYIQLWMIFFVHPLTILVLPALLGVYMVLEEKRREEAKYQLSSSKSLKQTGTVERVPQIRFSKYDFEKNLERYRKFFQRDEEPKGTS